MNVMISSIFSNLNDFISAYYFYSFILYFIISICFFTFSLTGGVIILIGSGFFFGFIQGFIINIFAISLGSLIFIIFSKTLLSKLFNKYYFKFSDKLSNYIKDSSYEYLLLIRLIIGPPLVFQNICIALLNISKTKIFITTFIGFTPLMLFLSYFGSYVSNIIDLKSYTFSELYSPEILFILVFFVILILLRIFFKK